MRKWRKYLLLLGVGVLAVMLVVVFVPSREPSYGGKRLSEWVEIYGSPERMSLLKQSAAAADAIRHIGTNGVPLLLKWMRYQPPRWKIRLYNKSEEVFGWPDAGRWQNDRQIFRAKCAAQAFTALGPDGAVAIGELSRMLTDPKSVIGGHRAATALANLGTSGLPPLLVVLTNRQARFVRGFAATSIGGMGNQALPAVPLLVQCLQEKDQILSSDALFALGRLKLEPDLVIPALMQSLSDTNELVRQSALVSLVKFGNENRRAVPAMSKLLEDPDETVRQVATNALREIDPKALERATR